MRDNTCLVIDVWEGQLEIDEAVLKASGVVGIGIRINDMNGGHHMDEGFAKQWKEAKGFVRFPYFVYNPWVDGAANFAWLAEHMPAEAKSVAIDVEVRYSGITPAKYAGELNKFMALADKRWKTIIYTGYGYLNLLSKWPAVDYWWAQYPAPQTYFGDVDTWEELAARLDHPALERSFTANKCPGTIKMWQFSGDYLILPGCKRDIDVNVFYGSKEELARYFGVEGTTELAGDPSAKPQNDEKEAEVVVSKMEKTITKRVGTVVANAVRVRMGPAVTTTTIGVVYKGEQYEVLKVMDLYLQTWGQIRYGERLAWVALEYLGQRLIEV